jgi:cell division protein FtsB
MTDEAEATPEHETEMDQPLAAAAGPPEPPEPTAADLEAEVPEESRIGRFLRRALRWITGFVVIFALGFGSTWLARVQPLQREVEQLEATLSDTNDARDRLQQQVDELEGVREENQSLAAALQENQGQLELLNILVDVTTAQLAIAQENPAAAAAALSDTDARLIELGKTLGSQQVAPLRERLALVIEEVEVDIFAAQRDLEILANTLISMERDLFGER